MFVGDGRHPNNLKFCFKYDVMMKKLLYFTIISFLLVSCSNDMENAPLSPDLGESQEITFTLETDAQIDTRSVTDISNIDRLSIAIYEVESGEMIVEPKTLDNVDFSSGSFSITVMLHEDCEYTAYFWAQSSQCNAYDFFKEPKKLAINYDNSLNNNQNYDAFFAKKTFVADGKNRQKVTMTRPFARINLMTSLEDWNAAIANGNKIVQSAVTIKGVGTEWNMDTDEMSCSDVTFRLADIPADNNMNATDNAGEGSEYKLLSCCYVMALPKTTKHEMTFQLKNERDKVIVRGPLSDIPMKRNNRTNIICDLKQTNVEYDLFYPSIQKALEGIGNGTFEESASANIQGAKVAIYTENDIPHIVLLEDWATDEVLVVNNDVCIELNGHTLSSTGNNVIKVSSGNLQLDGQQGKIKISNTQEGATISAIKVEENASLAAVDCFIEADCKRGFANAIHSFGNVTLTQCNIMGKADHTANAAKNNYATTSRAVFAEKGSLVVNDCYVYGMHSGITAKCELTVNGGTYDGYSHGGIYFAAENKIARIYNAKLNDAALLDGYSDDGRAGTNHAGMYIGGARNMNVYMDNCEIYGYSQPIVMKDNAASYLYISNSKMNLNYTHYGIRNDNSNFVCFGSRNEFGPNVLKYNRNYEETSEEYNADYMIK